MSVNLVIVVIGRLSSVNNSRRKGIHFAAAFIAVSLRALTAAMGQAVPQKMCPALRRLAIAGFHPDSSLAHDQYRPPTPSRGELGTTAPENSMCEYCGI